MTLRDFEQVRAADLSYQLIAIYKDGVSAKNFVDSNERPSEFLMVEFADWSIFHIFQEGGILILAIEEP